MQSMQSMQGITPISAETVREFLAVHARLCPTGADQAPVERYAAALGWPLERTRVVAFWCHERRLVDASIGLGDGPGDITLIERV